MKITKITSFFLAILYSLSAAFSVIPRAIWYGGSEYSAADGESILLDLALVSDMHSDSDYFHERSGILRKALCGISQTDCIPDALVISGDISNASDAREYAMLEWSMKTYNRIPAVIPAAGNHDVRARDTYEEAIGNFIDFADFCGIETEKAYYTADVKGYRFIVLGSEEQNSLEATISDGQAEWFENELVKAEKTEKPIFIICHQPLYNANQVVYNPEAEKNYGVGAQSGRLEEIIRKYVPGYGYPVFFITGHLHWAFGEKTVDTSFCENFVSITLPSLSKTDGGGLGMALEVYPDRVLLRARNYIEAEWIDGYRYEFPIG